MIQGSADKIPVEIAERATFHLTPVRPYRHAIQFVNKVGKEQTAIVHAHITSIMAQRFRWHGPPVGRRYRRGSIMIACPGAMRGGLRAIAIVGARAREREETKGGRGGRYRWIAGC